MIFLIEHLLTNSQAALWIGNDGNGFVRFVDGLHNLPYLQVLETALIGIPLLFHMVLGVKYLWSGKFNAHKSKGNSPSLPEYKRNHAYSWQRITSWILLFLIIFHVVKFRFLEYPHEVVQGPKSVYLVRVQMDNGLYTLADRLGLTIYNGNAIEQESRNLKLRSAESSLVDASESIRKYDKKSAEHDAEKGMIFTSGQQYLQKKALVDGLAGFSLKSDEVVVAAGSFGRATLLAVRDTFKSPIYIAIYTIFVLAACFHAFNGFWTFLITWGMILNMASQKRMAKFAVGLMVLIAFLGLAAVWGTYWINLKY